MSVVWECHALGDGAAASVAAVLRVWEDESASRVERGCVQEEKRREEDVEEWESRQRCRLGLCFHTGIDRMLPGEHTSLRRHGATAILLPYTPAASGETGWDRCEVVRKKRENGATDCEDVGRSV